MYISDRDPFDLPRPLTIDEVAQDFDVALMTLVAQPALTEAGVGTMGSSSNGGPTRLEHVSISYTLWRNPDDHDDPVNLADLDAVTRAALDAPPIRPMPDWFMTSRELMRFPIMSETVRTTRAGLVPPETAEAVLAHHADHVLTNQFRELRVVGGFPGTLDSPVSQLHLVPIPVRVDGSDVIGFHLDTDPHVYALGVDLGDRILTAVISRDDLPHVVLEFGSRSRGAAIYPRSQEE